MIKVLIVDDSALVRTLLREILSRQADIEVVGAASNPLVARDMIKKLDPDVLTLDIEMPQMDGLDFLGRLMRLRPMPVVMFSTLTERGSEMTLRALELGAVDFVAKPKLSLADSIEHCADEIVEKVRAAAKARLRRKTLEPLVLQEKHSADVILPPLKLSAAATEQVLVIGASTGGTEAIREVLTRMPADCPATLIVQHMPEAFTRPFAERLNRLCQIEVMEAEAGMQLKAGHAYIAPGSAHLLLIRRGKHYYTALNDGPPVNRHRPSVDVLFRSAANCAGKNAVGALLTGMGKDGAAGLLEMKEAGAYTLAQDEDSCVVFGMPHEAIVLGAAREVASLSKMAERMLAAVRRA